MTPTTRFSDPEVALKTRSVDVTYGRTAVLRNLDLTVPRGGIYGLLGRNGVGKSTLVRCLLGQEPPTSGEVLLLGRDPWHHRAELMHTVGVVPEAPQVPPSSHAEELLAFGARLYPNWQYESARRRLARFGVPLEVPFRRLSKGQQKQVELALALAQGPQLLVLDDPSLGLDSVARRILYEELLEHLADEGVTVFLTSHDLDAIERLVDTVAVLHEGRLLVEDSLDTVKARYRRYSLPEGQAPPPGTRLVVERIGAWGREVVVEFDPSDSHPTPADGGRSMALEEIFEALVGPAPSPDPVEPESAATLGGAA